MTVNIVTKRGTNEWRGSGRYILHRRRLAVGSRHRQRRLRRQQRQRRAAAEPGDLHPQQHRRDQGVRRSSSAVRSSRIACGSGAPTARTTDRQHRRSTGQHDITVLENSNGKLNAQIVAVELGERAVQRERQDQERPRRRRHARSRRPRPTRSGVGGKPSDILKVEDTHDLQLELLPDRHVLASSTAASSWSPRAASTHRRRCRTPTASTAAATTSCSTTATSTQYKLDASAFFNTGSARNELKFGASHRLAETVVELRLSPATSGSYNCAVVGCGGDRAGPNTGCVEHLPRLELGRRGRVRRGLAAGHDDARQPDRQRRPALRDRRPAKCCRLDHPGRRPRRHHVPARPQLDRASTPASSSRRSCRASA